MPSTYEPIASTTLGSDTADVTFSSISGTYTDLILVTNLGVTSVDNAVSLRFNGDSGSNYSVTNLYGDGSTASSARATGLSNVYIAWYVDPIVAIQETIITHIMSYSNTTTNKTLLSRANRASSGNYPGAEAIAGLWRSTAAITSVRIAGGGNLKAGSTFTLYGVKSA
jgi:hypothetical protein